jgi:hypothetical protein
MKYLLLVMIVNCLSISQPLNISTQPMPSRDTCLKVADKIHETYKENIKYKRYNKIITECVEIEDEMAP